jgi:alpha-D-ribose 1-methylphosphonate 5-triphosphate synthase subunit PhnH
MIPAEALLGGFADRVFDSQSVFRSVLTALSRPGRVVECVASVTAPSPLATAAASAIATLADGTSPVWLDGALSAGAAPAWIAFQTGARIVSDPEKAAFALISDPLGMPDFAVFAQGTAEYPDRSCTLIVQVASLEGGPNLVLKGPGIKDLTKISPHPLPADFVFRMWANRALFPRGVDLILVAGQSLLGLPRTTRVEAA